MLIHRWNPQHDGLAQIDVLTGKWAYRSDVSVYYPTPSLVQHIGHVSALWTLTLQKNRSEAQAAYGWLLGCREFVERIGQEMKPPRFADEVPRARLLRGVNLETVLEHVIDHYGVAPDLRASRGNGHIARAVSAWLARRLKIALVRAMRSAGTRVSRQSHVERFESNAYWLQLVVDSRKHSAWKLKCQDVLSEAAR